MNKLIWKIIIGILSCLVALLLPYVILSSSECVHLVRYYGYWGIAFTFICFLYFLFRRLAAPSIWRQWLLAHRWGLISALAVTVFFQAHEKHEMKILFDEFVINLTAMEMHHYQEAAGTTVTHHYQGYSFPTKKMVDKRPIFFPFVLSLVHTVSGFRVENVYYLNAALTFGFLFLLYTWVTQLTNKCYGVFSVLLFATLPLLAQNANGGGFEILNLLLILALMLVSKAYLEGDGLKHLNLMVMTALLLANTRYESILYLLVPVFLVLLRWWRTREMKLSWFTVFTPLFLILPLFCLQVFKSNDGFFDYNRESFFGFQHIYGNIIASVVYLFDCTGDYSNSVFISTTGIVSLLFSILIFVRHRSRILRQETGLVIFYLFLILISGITLMLMNYHWAEWTDARTSRFSLSLQLVMVIATASVMYWGFEWKQVSRWIIAAPLLAVIIFSGKAYGRTAQRTQLYSTIGYNWMVEYANRHLDTTRSLFIAPGNGLFILKGWASMPTVLANEIPEKIERMKELELYDEVYVAQFLRMDGMHDIAVDYSVDPLSPRYILEPVAQKWVRVNYLFRLSKIVGVREIDEPRWKTADINFPRSMPTERMDDKAYLDYIIDLFRVEYVARLATPVQSDKNNDVDDAGDLQIP